MDTISGKIYVFATLWSAGDHSMRLNTAWVIIWDDDGLTWSEPSNLMRELVAPNHFIGGLGQDSGLQLTGNKQKNRLNILTRQKDGEKSKNGTGYRVDHGETWQKGAQAPIVFGLLYIEYIAIINVSCYISVYDNTVCIKGEKTPMPAIYPKTVW